MQKEVSRRNTRVISEVRPPLCILHVVHLRKVPFPVDCFFTLQSEGRTLRVSINEIEVVSKEVRRYQIVAPPARSRRENAETKRVIESFAYCRLHQNCCKPEDRTFCLKEGQGTRPRSECQRDYCKVTHRECCKHVRVCNEHHKLC